MDFFIQMINGLGLGSIYALVALGYSMVYGIIQLINFAHGDIIMVGGYVVFVVMVQLGLAALGGGNPVDCGLHPVGRCHRASRVPSPAGQGCAAPVFADYGDRREHFPAKSISAWLYLQRSVDAGDVPQQGDYPRQPATKL